MAKVKGRLVYETPTWEELQEQKDAGILAAPTPTPVPTWEELQIQKDQGIFSEPTPAPTAGIGGAFSEPTDISQLPQLAAVPESEIPFNLNMVPLPFVPIVPINLSNVVTAGTGLAKFTALRELESYIISKVTGKEYKFGVTKGVSEFLPEDTSQGVKDVVDILEMFGQGALIAKTDPKLMKLWKAATEKITTDANIPKKVYISNEAIRSIYQTGENITPEQMQVYKDLGLSGKQISSLLKSKADIEVDVIANMDKPWFAKMKTLFGIKPKSQIIVKPEGIAVKQTGVEALPWETTQAPLIKGKAAGAQETAVETPVETAEQPQEGLIKAYHGTKYDFENFDVLHRGKLTKAESAKNAFFFTDKKDIAEGYATLGESEKVEALLTKAEELEKIAQKSGKNDDWKNYEEAYREYENASLTESEAGGVKGQTKEVYLDMKNPYIKDKQGHAYEEKELATWVKEAKEKGHDGIIIKNAADSVNTPIESGKRPESEISTIYGVFEPNQIKQSFIPPPVQETPIEPQPSVQETAVETPKEIATRAAEIKSVPIKNRSQTEIDYWKDRVESSKREHYKLADYLRELAKGKEAGESITEYFKREGLEGFNQWAGTVLKSDVEYPADIYQEQPAIQPPQPGPQPVQPQGEAQVPTVQGTGELKERGLSVHANKRIIQMQSELDFQDQTLYQQADFKAMGEKVDQVFATNPELGMKIAMGEEKPVEGTLAGMYWTAAENQAILNKDTQTLKKLMNSKINEVATALGQNVAAFRERNPDSPIRIVKEINTMMEEEYKKRQPRISIEQARQKQETRLKEDIKKQIPNKDVWANFIDSITC